MMYRGENGSWRTRTLFVEMCPADLLEKYDPPYTLNEEDCVKGGKEYKSLYKIFMTCTDVYEFATTYLGGLSHWESLNKSKWFSKPYKYGHKGTEHWIDSMKKRDESHAKRALIQAVREGKVQAASKLYEISKTEDTTKRGRFKKDEAIRQVAQKVEDDSFLTEAVERLNVVNLREQ